MTLKIKLVPGGKMPTRATAGSSGLDLYALLPDHPHGLTIWDKQIIRTGACLELPPGYEAQVRPRSGLASKHGVVAVTGTIDNDYRGEVLVTLIVHGAPYVVRDGDRIAQLVIAPVAYLEPVEVDELSETVRGDNGHGSTGVR